jgi:Rrf2 family protein
MSKVLALSEAVGIALHSMALIAMHDKPHNVTSLTEETGASKHHIAKVMQRLVKAGLLKSTRGPAGGFVLVKPAKDITLLEIYEVIEGKVSLHECPMDCDICPLDNICMLGEVGERVAKEFVKHMKETNLQDIKDEHTNK